MKVFTILILAAASAWAPLPAHAQVERVEIGDWTIEPEGVTRCHMLGSFGDNVISFAADPAGNGNLAFFSSGPGLKEAPYSGSYSFDAWKTEHPATLLARNLPRGGKLNRLLATGIRSDFFVSLSRAKHLWLRIPDIALDDEVDIPDWEKIFHAFAECIRAIDNKAR